MSNFFDAIFLSRFDRENGAHIYKFHPSNFDFLNQKNIFSICSFPESQSDSTIQNDKSKIPTTIYATTIENKNCYILSFLFPYLYTNTKVPNSIAILSHKMIASEIFKILLDVRSFLFQLIKEETERINKTSITNKNSTQKNSNTNNDNSYNQNNTDEILYNLIPERILDELWKCIQLCTFDHKNYVLTVVTPIRKFRVILGNEHFTYSQFDPNFWLASQTNLYLIWRALMTNRGILIVGDSPSQVSCAVFSIISLAAPLKYCEPYIAYTRLGDPRFAEIISDQSRKWKIVGTTNSLLAERCKQFAIIGILSPIKGEKYKEIDPDFLQQKFLKETKILGRNSYINDRNSNSRNSSHSFNLKKLDFFNFKSFSNSMNSIFSFQLNENDSSETSQSSFISTTESFSRSIFCNSLRNATKKMMNLIEFRLNNKIEFDPYFDVLSKELQEEDFYGIFIESSKSKKKKQESNETECTNDPKLNSIFNESRPNTNFNEPNIITDTFQLLSKKNEDEDDDFEIDANSIINELSIASNINNININNNAIQINKIRTKQIMKSMSLFNTNIPSSRETKISSFYLNNYKKKNPKIHFFTTKDAMRLQNSLTFKDWRKNITYRSHFRESFLSIFPIDALSERSQNELSEIYKYLVADISSKYERDFHMTAVIKRHIHIARNLLGLVNRIKNFEIEDK